MRVRNIKYVSVRLRAWSRVKGKAERERNGRGLLSFFSPLPSLSFFLSFFLFVRSNYSSGWIVINVITPSTTTEKLRAGDRIGWKRNNGRGGRDSTVKSLAAFFDRPGTCALRLATQCVSYKRQDRNDSERKWTDLWTILTYSPRPDISPPYVSMERDLYSTTTPGFRGYLVARFVKLLSTTSDHLDYYGIKKNRALWKNG